jgi:hypothetical protein
MNHQSQNNKNNKISLVFPFWSTEEKTIFLFGQMTVLGANSEFGKFRYD